MVPAELPLINEPVSILEPAEVGREIGANWRKATADVLRTAELSARAFSLYGPTALPIVLRAAGLSRSTFMKLVVIGRDARLRPIEEVLPPNYSIIHQISQLDDRALDEAVEVGVIHPNVRRAEIEALRRREVPKGGERAQAGELPIAVKELSAGRRYEFALPADIRWDHCEQVKRSLGMLQIKFGVQIVPIKELDTAAPKPIATPTIASGPAGSPVNKPTVGTQALAPSKAPNAGNSPGAKRSQ
jgi:hypothetical protein